MFKRTASIALLLFVSAASIIGLDMWQRSSAVPTSVTNSTQPPALSSAASALWITEGAYSQNGEMPSVVAVDPQTGNILLRTLPFGGAKSSDARWQYVVEAAGTTLRLTTIDLKRGSITRIMGLPPTVLAHGGDLLTQVALSQDDRTLAVVATGNAGIGTRWRTLVYLVNVETGEATQRIDLFYHDAEPNWQPQIQAIFSQDGARLFVIHDRQRRPADGKAVRPVWTTQIAVVSRIERKLERIVDVPGEVEADGFWQNSLVSPDGHVLYLMRRIIQGNSMEGYRFAAFDTEHLQVTRVQSVPQNAGSGPFCQAYSRLTPDGRYLWAFCSPDSGRRGGHVQFLDTQAGLVTKQVMLERQAARAASGDFFGARQLISSDHKLLYVVYPTSKEIFVLDLMQQAVVRSAVLQETKSTSANPLYAMGRWLAAWLVGSASAKFAAQPAALLSPDGQRLYFLDMADLEKGDGLWAVETSSLNVIGHWMKGQDITGIQLSADGRELYALGLRDHTLYVFDALSGQALRQFGNVLKQPYGFATE